MPTHECDAGCSGRLGLFRTGRAGRRRTRYRTGGGISGLCAESNAVYVAWKAALQDAKTQPDYEVPPHLRNAPTN